MGISFFSTYRIPELSETNWDSALFLTPLGMIKNFNNANPVMRSFYSDLSSGQISLSIGQIIAIVLLLLLQVFNFYKLIKLIRQ